MAGKDGQTSAKGAVPTGSARVANVLGRLKQSGMVPGYAPDTVGAEAHNPDEPGVIWVDVDHILDSPYQHQEQIAQEEFQALVDSIQKEGFLAALNVNEHAQRAGYYFLTAGGHQRRDAARAAGKMKIPVFVEPTLDPIRLAFRAAKENAVRVNTSPVNLGQLFLQIQDEFQLTQDEIAGELRKGRNFVKFCIMAARSAQDIQEMLQAKPDSLRAMTYLRRLDSEADRAPIIAQFLAGELTTDGVEATVEAVLSRQARAKQTVHLGPEETRHTGGASENNEERGNLEASRKPSISPSQANLLESHASVGPPRLDLPTKAPSVAAGGVGGASALDDEEPMEDPQTLERVGKLRAIFSRLETYETSRGAAITSQGERNWLKRIVEKGQALQKAERESSAD